MKNTKPRECTNIFVEIDGENIRIQDLPKEDYEDFLESMNKLRLIYLSTLSK